MKKRLIVAVLILVLIFIGKIVATNLNAPHVTIDEVEMMLEEYEELVSEYINTPSENKMRTVEEAYSSFLNGYTSIDEHQTVFNRWLRNKQVLSDRESTKLKEMYRTADELELQYIDTTINNVFLAKDFEDVLVEVEKDSFYQSNSIEVVKSNHDYRVTINGKFQIEDKTAFSNKYFIIETHDQNYVWKKPKDYTVSYTASELIFKIGDETYKILATIQSV